MFGKTFIYKRLHISTQVITEHTCNASDILSFLKQLNKWNAESAEKKNTGRQWVYWTEEI